MPPAFLPACAHSYRKHSVQGSKAADRWPTQYDILSSIVKQQKGGVRVRIYDVDSYIRIEIAIILSKRGSVV